MLYYIFVSFGFYIAIFLSKRTNRTPWSHLPVNHNEAEYAKMST